MEILELINLGLLFLGAALIIIELFFGLESTFDLVLSGIAIFIGGLFGIIAGNLWFVGLIAAIILLILYWIAGRQFVHKQIHVDISHTNVDRLVGMEGKVKRITPKGFVVSVEGEEWTAESTDELKIDDIIHIKATKGTILEVSKKL